MQADYNILYATAVEIMDCDRKGASILNHANN